jgi:hypothetical protein
MPESLQITNVGDTRKDKQYAIKDYILPKSDPWIVEINGFQYTIPSQVGRLLLHLAKQQKAKSGPSKSASK